MPLELATGYLSGGQIARRVSEGWIRQNFYCISCTSARLHENAANTKAVDFACVVCGATYQLKAGKKWNSPRVPDGAYSTMLQAIQNDQTPNLLLMQYSSGWNVKNLMAVPRFFFTANAIEKRKPLATTARRAGWIGCNILLDRIVPEGRIMVVSDGVVRPTESVRRQYRELLPIAGLPVQVRGWSLEVLNAVRLLNRQDFSLADVYGFEVTLGRRYPQNHNVRAKIRQQLQILRDLKLVSFEGRGKYRLTFSLHDSPLASKRE